jgi:hypothetical protein
MGNLLCTGLILRFFVNPLPVVLNVSDDGLADGSSFAALLADEFARGMRVGFILIDNRETAAFARKEQRRLTMPEPAPVTRTPRLRKRRLMSVLSQRRITRIAQIVEVDATVDEYESLVASVETSKCNSSDPDPWLKSYCRNMCSVQRRQCRGGVNVNRPSPCEY